MQELIAIAETNGSEEALAIAASLRVQLNFICGYCDGRGHNLSNCSTKRTQDRSFRKLGFGATWGGIKSHRIEANVEAAILTRQERVGIKARAARHFIEAKKVERRNHLAVLRQQNQAQQQ